MSGSTEITITCTGDLVLGLPEPEKLLAASRATFAASDLVIGHVELAHTDRPVMIYGLSAPSASLPPERLSALAEVGVDIATLAGNHLFDSGPNGVADTISTLTNLGISTAGGGLTLDQARTPAIREVGNRTVGVLSYNCVGPHQSWASANKAGAAYLEIITHYENTYESPGGPPDKVYSFVTPVTQAAMVDDIRGLRRRADIVVVALHKGIGHIPAVLAMYEQPLARSAIDAGADVVIGHHAHILRGVETYRGKPVFHGLGNYLTVTHQLSVDPKANPSPERLAWARKRRELFGFEPDPAYPTYPFHPQARHTMLAHCAIQSDGSIRAGFLPCRINTDGGPEVLPRGPTAEAVVTYVREINSKAGLNAELSWRENAVVFV